VCLDFYCHGCDARCHYDGRFVYYLRCPTCQATYAMPTLVALKRVAPDEVDGIPKTPVFMRRQPRRRVLAVGECRYAGEPVDEA